MPELRRRIAWHAAPVMFVLSLVFLICQAVLVVMWVDVPNLNVTAIAAADPNTPVAAAGQRVPDAGVVGRRIQQGTMWVMLLIWPVVIVESIWHWFSRPWRASYRGTHFYSLLACACPSLRMGARSPEMHGRLWLPKFGWRQANRRLRMRLERRFSLPMILIALLILPVLLIEFFLRAQVAQHTWLRTMLHVGTGLIWFAFAFEFILKVAVAKKKLDYCKQHWIDIAIIVLPIFSFLRSLQFIRATRIAQLVHLPLLTKLVRVYRLRGTAVKAFQGLLVLEFFHRIVGTRPEHRIARLERQLAEVESEAKQLRRKIVKLQRLRDQAAA